MADLLSSSTSPNLAPSASTTQTVLPDWYTNYAQQILANQQTQSSTPYTPYTAPRVADFTPDQQAGFAATEAAAGSAAPALTAAQGALTTAAGITPSAGAQGYLSAASAPAYSTVQNYLNPYESNVTDQIAQLGNQNLTQNILPAIGNEFVSAGGYGGSRDAETIGRAIQTTQGNITAAQAAALAQGYTSSLGAAQTDASKNATLASTAGNLGALDVNAGLASGQALENLGTTTQNAGLTGAGALTSIGGQQQQLDQTNLTNAYQDFLTQQGYNQTQINAMLAALSGTKPAVPTSTLQTGYGAVPTSATTTTPSGVQDIASILGALSTAGVI